MAILDPNAVDLAQLRPIAHRASLVVTALVGRPNLVDASDLDLSAAAGTGVSVASAVIRVLISWGWIEAASGSPRRIAVSGEQMLALSHRLRGIGDVALMDVGPAPVEAVVTLPGPGGALKQALGGTLDAHATRDGFGHVASSAHNRLVFLVPFVDVVGAETLVQLLAISTAPERIVIVRPDYRGSRWHLPHLAAMRGAGAQVLEFWRPPPPGIFPPPMAETFHAKVALADRELAYVGSSNFMISSLDTSLECGVLVRGEQARVFGMLIDAVVAVSTPVASI